MAWAINLPAINTCLYSGIAQWLVRLSCVSWSFVFLLPKPFYLKVQGSSLLSCVAAGSWQHCFPGPAELYSEAEILGILSSFPSSPLHCPSVTVLLSAKLQSPTPLGVSPVSSLPPLSTTYRKHHVRSVVLFLSHCLYTYFAMLQFFQEPLFPAVLSFWAVSFCVSALQNFPSPFVSRFSWTLYSAHKGCGVSQIIAVHALLLLMFVQLSSNCRIAQFPLLGILCSRIDLDHSGVKRLSSWTSHDDN